MIPAATAMALSHLRVGLLRRSWHGVIPRCYGRTLCLEGRGGRPATLATTSPTVSTNSAVDSSSIFLLQDRSSSPLASPVRRPFSTTPKGLLNYRRLFMKHRLSAEQWRISDGIERDYNLIYQGHSTNYVRLGVAAIQGQALLTSAGLALLAIFSKPIEVPLVEVAGYLSFGSFIAICTILLARVYCLRMYYSEERKLFKLILLGVTPFHTRTLEVAPGQVKHRTPKPVNSGAETWDKGLYVTQNKHIIMLLEKNFAAPVYFNMLLGYSVR